MSSDSLHWHRCELADHEQSFLRSATCQKQFSCDDSHCKGKQYCPQCLLIVIEVNVGVMYDY